MHFPEIWMRILQALVVLPTVGVHSLKTPPIHCLFTFPQGNSDKVPTHWAITKQAEIEWDSQSPLRLLCFFQITTVISVSAVSPQRLTDRLTVPHRLWLFLVILFVVLVMKCSVCFGCPKDVMPMETTYSDLSDDLYAEWVKKSKKATSRLEWKFFLVLMSDYIIYKQGRKCYLWR